MTHWCWKLNREGVDEPGGAEELILRTRNFLPLAISNGIRRIIIDEVPSVGFDMKDVEVEKNTTQFSSEVIAQRCSFIPIFYNRPDLWSADYEVVLEGSLEKGEPGPRMLTSGDLRVTLLSGEGSLTITNRDIDIVELIRGIGPTCSPAIKLKMKPTIGSGMDNASFMPCSDVSWRHVPRWELELTGGDESQIASADDVRDAMDRLNADLAPRRRYIELQKDIERNYMGTPRVVEMRLRNSVGRMDAMAIWWHAMRIMEQKIVKYMNDVSNIDSPNIERMSSDDIPGLETIIIDDEDDTLGCLIKSSFIEEHMRLIEEMASSPADRDMLITRGLAQYTNLNVSEKKLTVKLLASPGLGVDTLDVMQHGLQNYLEIVRTMKRELEDSDIMAGRGII